MLDEAPRNSESRFLGVAFRWLRANYPNLEWVLSFADATQCGDGTIYRATGFLLTQIRKNRTMYLINGQPQANMTLTKGRHAIAQNGSASILARTTLNTAKLVKENNGAAGTKKVIEKRGLELLEGYQLRYIKFLKPEARARLTCPVLSYEAIGEKGAGMYRGRRKDSREPSC